MEPKKYATAASFRRALEDRLQAIAKKEGVDLQRLRRQVAFDRFLARLFQAEDPNHLPWVLKGGYAMELRMKAARTTKDIDLTARGVSGTAHTKGETEKHAVLARLQEITAKDCGEEWVAVRKCKWNQLTSSVSLQRSPENSHAQQSKRPWRGAKISRQSFCASWKIQ